MRVRVRFAPSPTGLFHIGSARTALFNWLFAKSNDGDFILRVEDTDKERSKPEFEIDIKENLDWLGLKWDEFYRQSDRLDIYKKYLSKLLEENKLYHCFCSKEDLEAERQAMLSQGLAPKYSGRCGSLSKAEVEKRLKESGDRVLRFRIPEGVVNFKDMIKGAVKFDAGLMGDLIVAKDFDQPLYNFTVVVDDALMEISHVIRGDDHLSNTPKQILIAQALGFNVPEFAHLPIILNPNRSKMSKRFSDTAMKDYRENGYLKDAIINFLAYLGWHPKEDKEIMTSDELIKEFTLERVQKAGAIFNYEKLDWLNSYYLNHSEIDEFMSLAKPFLPPEWKLNKPMVESVRGRIKKMGELKELVNFYFKLPEYESEILKWKDMDSDKVVFNLDKLSKFIKTIEEKDFVKDKLENSLMEEVSDGNKGEFFWPLRVALSGNKVSPGPFEIMESLGKTESLRRIELAIGKSKQ